MPAESPVQPESVNAPAVEASQGVNEAPAIDTQEIIVHQSEIQSEQNTEANQTGLEQRHQVVEVAVDHEIDGNLELISARTDDTILDTAKTVTEQKQELDDLTIDEIDNLAEEALKAEEKALLMEKMAAMQEYLEQEEASENVEVAEVPVEANTESGFKEPEKEIKPIDWHFDIKPEPVRDAADAAKEEVKDEAKAAVKEQVKEKVIDKVNDKVMSPAVAKSISDNPQVKEAAIGLKEAKNDNKDDFRPSPLSTTPGAK